MARTHISGSGQIERDGRGGSGLAKLVLGLIAMAFLLNPPAESLRLFLRARRTTSTLGQFRGALFDITKYWFGGDELEEFNSFHLFSTGRSGGQTYVGLFGVWVELEWSAAQHVGDIVGQALKQDLHRILLLNAAIFVLWMVLPSRFMEDHFTVSRRNLGSGRVHCLLSSVFSQQAFLHLLGNTVSLLSIGPELLRIIGRGFFWELFLMGGMAGAALSALVQPRASSCGASGAVYALLAFNAALNPDRMQIIAGFELTNVQLVYTLLGIDLVSHWSGSTVDFVCHVGGAVFASVYCQHVNGGGQGWLVASYFNLK